jgi:hypothetical protein
MSFAWVSSFVGARQTPRTCTNSQTSTHKFLLIDLQGEKGKLADVTPCSAEKQEAAPAFLMKQNLSMVKVCVCLKVEAQDVFMRWHGQQLKNVPNVLWRNLRNSLYSTGAKFVGWHSGRLGGLGLGLGLGPGPFTGLRLNDS